MLKQIFCNVDGFIVNWDELNNVDQVYLFEPQFESAELKVIRNNPIAFSSVMQSCDQH